MPRRWRKTEITIACHGVEECSIMHDGYAQDFLFAPGTASISSDRGKLVRLPTACFV
jgi:hypothetical protein